MKSLNLADTQRDTEIPNSMLNYEPAHISRYLITARLIKQIVGANPDPKILDVGGKKGLLREFDIKSIIIDLEESEEEDYIQGDALSLPFEDSSFDVVVSCDVLEHISKEHREKFISEMIRVTKSYVVLCAPFNQDGVSNSEESANQFYKDIAGQDHRWLIEHIENELPDVQLVEGFLKKRKLSHQFFRHLSLDIWDITTKIHFMGAAFGDSEDINRLTRTIYEKYYYLLCDLDYTDNGYRTFCVINKNEKFVIELPKPGRQEQAKIQYKEFLNAQLLNCLKNTNLHNRVHNQVQSKVQQRQARKIANLEAELQNIKNSKSWKLAQKVTKARNFYK